MLERGRCGDEDANTNWLSAERKNARSMISTALAASGKICYIALLIVCSGFMFNFLF
jgi:hypothetical protein